MGLTVAQARDIVEDHIDDSGNARWSESQVDNALRYALDSCRKEYLAAGGDRLFEISESTTDSNGRVDLSSLNPDYIAGVTLVMGNRFFPLSQVQYEERLLNDNAARSIQVRYARTLSLSSTTSHPLVGNGATAAKSFDAFEHWICARAAMFCSVKDADNRPELKELELQAKNAAMFAPHIPQSTAFPGKPHWYSRYYVWTWKPDEQKLQLARKGWF